VLRILNNSFKYFTKLRNDFQKILIFVAFLKISTKNNLTLQKNEAKKMILNCIEPKVALNPAYRRQNLQRIEIDLFKANLIQLFNKINDSESEEHNKNVVSDFLKDTYYKSNFEINTSGRKDLAIHYGKSSKEPVAVIIEAKKPTNKADMIAEDKLSAKAFYELIHYYLDERLIKSNKEIRYLIITNIYKWFIFDAADFERIFLNNKQLTKDHNDWKNNVLPASTTDWFYRQIAKPFVENNSEIIECTYVNLNNYLFISELNNAEFKVADLELIDLFKIFSPEHLLKLPFANDSNYLNKDFYNELLPILGLCEEKHDGIKTIERLPAKERNEGSVLENTISIIKTYDKLANITDLSEFGETPDKQLYSVALELCITWINRILFLKLLEGQLIKYNAGNQDSAFLNSKKLANFGELSELFFDVLAVKIAERTPEINNKYANIPYLNSSLFEISELERQTISMNQLKDRFELPIYSLSVLKEYQSGERLHGKKNTLLYLFEFLDAYDFTNDNKSAINEQNKSIISASVLGLIFEKINGYKDGSFFTPGFITMYICRETIRKTVLQKFNSKYNWNCTEFNLLISHFDRNKIKEYSDFINTIRICDPAVGSGHFLVSALNELIAIKSELNILIDKNGKPFNSLVIRIENDELMFYQNYVLFEYQKPYLHAKYQLDRPSHEIIKSENQRIQETIFNEKQTLIENCLFGVDINAKSVQICRLRLWIELLKHAYYTEESKYQELETLPNIDINIKCGNSLVSRYALNGSGFANGQAKKMQLTTQKYKDEVIIYKNTTDKVTRKNTLKNIKNLKSEFSDVVNLADEDFKKMRQIDAEMKERRIIYSEEERIQSQNRFIELSEQFEEIKIKLEKKNKSLYNNAFEWRFEFPEVLDENGNFVGFDVIIGNPPYGIHFSEIEKEFYRKTFAAIHVRTPESFNYFWGLSFKISSKSGFCNFIVPSSFLNQIEFEKTRKQILQNNYLYVICNLGDNVFHEVATPTCVVGFSKIKYDEIVTYSDITNIKRSEFSKFINSSGIIINRNSLETNESYSFHYKPYKDLIEKCYKYSTLKEIAEEVATGVSTGLDKAYVFKLQEINEKKLESKLLKKLIIGGEINKYILKPVSTKQLIYITDKIELHKYPNIEQEISKYKEELIKRREAANGSIKWYSLNWPRRQKLFDEPKILIRQTANKIIATYDDQKWYCLKSGLIVQLPKNSKINYYYLLGLLNSKLINFIYQDLVPEQNRIFPEVKPVQLFKLPICTDSPKLQSEIEKKVIKIINSKSTDSQVDTKVLEKQIDEIVYQLYNLTNEEIKLIENN